MNQQFDYLESRIRPNLEAVKARVESVEQTIISTVGFSNNDFFPLRAYLSFLRDTTGNEVALTVDVKKCDGGFTIQCEILKGEGQILAEMLSFNFNNSASANDVSSADRWVANFERFLVEKFEVLHSAVHNS